MDSTIIAECSPDDGQRFDLISLLPVEITSTIFQMLDPEEMFSALRVSKNWNMLYRADRPLRRAISQKVIERRRRKLDFLRSFSIQPVDDSWYTRGIPALSP